MDRRIGERQRWSWLTAGLWAVIAACACGLGWLWILGAGLLASGCYIYVDKRVTEHGLAAMLTAAWGNAGKIPAVLTALWTIVMMAWAAGLASGAFPESGGSPVLGWILLALAAWGSWKGAGASARCAGVLCLILIGLYGAVLLFAVPDIRLENVWPEGTWQDGLNALGLFLLPAAVWYVPCTRSRKGPAWPMALVLPLSAAALAVVTAGVLSPTLARALPSPLYTLAQSVSLFGVVERIEPLLSVAMTMGVFCLLASMACACSHLWDQIYPWKWSGAASCVVAGAIMLVEKRMNLSFLALGNILFWVLIPLVTLWIGKVRENKLEMVEKQGENHNL